MHLRPELCSLKCTLFIKSAFHLVTLLQKATNCTNFSLENLCSSVVFAGKSFLHPSEHVNRGEYE